MSHELHWSWAEGVIVRGGTNMNESCYRGEQRERQAVSQGFWNSNTAPWPGVASHEEFSLHLDLLWLFQEDDQSPECPINRERLQVSSRKRIVWSWQSIICDEQRMTRSSLWLLPFGTSSSPIISEQVRLREDESGLPSKS